MKEEERINELYSYQILDTLPEKELNEIVELTSLICNTPIAQITIIDKDRQWIKASYGIPAQEVPREYSFCHHAIGIEGDVLEVPDSTADPRFKNNPFVIGEPKVRFYAGSPLITPSGHFLGALCVIDTKPRKLSTEQRRALKIFGEKIMRYFEMRKNNFSLQKELDLSLRKLDELGKNLEAIGNNGVVGSWSWNIQENKLTWSKEMNKLTGVDYSLDEWKVPLSQSDWFSMLKEIKNAKKSSNISKVHKVKKANEEEIWIESRIEIKLNGQREIIEVSGTSFDVTLRKKYKELLEEIIFSVSHTIRRPVTSLQGLVYLLTSHENLDEVTIKEYMSKFKIVADELSNYTSNLTHVFINKEIT